MSQLSPLFGPYASYLSRYSALHDDPVGPKLNDPHNAITTVHHLLRAFDIFRIRSRKELKKYRNSLCHHPEK